MLKMSEMAVCMSGMWLCSHEGDQAPEKCPVCGVLREIQEAGR